jgi:hypothetical protein
VKGSGRVLISGTTQHFLEGPKKQRNISIRITDLRAIFEPHSTVKFGVVTLI